MEDSYIIRNLHVLCRLCLCKNSLMISLFGPDPDQDGNISLISKINTYFDMQIDPNDGLPEKICYKCLYKLKENLKFKFECIQNESRLKQITSRMGELDTSTSSGVTFNNNLTDHTKIKSEDYIVEDSVVMVVDPSMDYDSSDDSDKGENGHKESKHVNIQEEEPTRESFLKNVFMCQFCDKAFITREKCMEHEQKYHDPNYPYRCLECSIMFSERTQYVQHTKLVHGNDKPYQCSECEKSFGRRSDLRKHSIVHTGIRPYQCHYCLKGFSRNTNLSKHLRIHAGKTPHVCPICPRSFVAKADLQRHVVVHSRVKPYACQKCPLTFVRRDNLIKHQVSHGVEHKENLETEEDTDDIVVNVNPFNNIMSSPSHENADYELPRIPDHISGDNSFINQVHRSPAKSRKFTQNSPTKQRLANKNRPKNIKCHQCPKRFSSLDAYKTHVTITHRMFLPTFQCKICFRKFTRKRELDRHAVVHAGIEPFKCSQCDKQFTRKDKLDEHEQSHEVLFENMPCTECGAVFDKKDDLVAHIKSHFSDNYEDKGSEGDINTDHNQSQFSNDNAYDSEGIPTEN